MMKTGTKPAEPEASEGPSIADVDHDERLIRWMLERTPEERLEVLQDFAEGIVALQHAKKCCPRALGMTAAELGEVDGGGDGLARRAGGTPALPAHVAGPPVTTC